MTEVFSERNVVSRSSMHEKESLRNALDEYFERYLNLVNEYQLLQRSLAKVLSSVEGAIPQNDWTCTQVLFQGHFSLAQANYSNPARRRYGQDFYDDRMQASTRMYASEVTANVERRTKFVGTVTLALLQSSCLVSTPS